MNRYILIITIVSLISFTTFIKSTTKNLENDIYNKRESIELLDTKYDLIFLENNYLTSPEKLFKYFEDLSQTEYTPIDISKINKINFFEKKIEIQNFLKNE